MQLLSRTIGWAGVRYFFWRFNAQAFGTENIPRSGPVLFVGNHQSNFDGVLVVRSIPRRLHTMVKSDGEDPKALLMLNLFADMFTIHRNSRDLTAIRKAQEILRRGGALCMFPTAHRSVKVIGFHPGVSTIARGVEDLKIVPFGITNSNRSVGSVLRNLGATKMQAEIQPTIRFGRPFQLPPAHLSKRDQRKADARRIRRRVLELLPKDMEGEDILHVVER